MKRFKITLKDGIEVTGFWLGITWRGGFAKVMYTDHKHTIQTQEVEVGDKIEFL